MRLSPIQHFLVQNWVTLKYRPSHHSISLDSAYTGRDSGVVRYKRASLELGPVVESEKVSSEIIP